MAPYLTALQHAAPPQATPQVTPQGISQAASLLPLHHHPIPNPPWTSPPMTSLEQHPTHIQPQSIGPLPPAPPVATTQQPPYSPYLKICQAS